MHLSGERRRGPQRFDDDVHNSALHCGDTFAGCELSRNGENTRSVVTVAREG